jgi:hypothetical protein
LTRVPPISGEAVTTASGFGCFIFPPVGFRLLWYGHDLDEGDWFALLDAVQYPGLWMASSPATAPHLFKQAGGILRMR